MHYFFVSYDVLIQLLLISALNTSCCRAMQKQDNRVQPRIKNKGVIVDLFVLWLALTALSCAAINLHISLNKLEPKEEE